MYSPTNCMAEIYARQRERNEELERHERANRDVACGYAGLSHRLSDPMFLQVASYLCAKPVVTREAFIKHCKELGETDLYRELFVPVRDCKLVGVDALSRSCAVCKELKRQKIERESELAERREAPLNTFLGPITRRSCSGVEQINGRVQKTTPCRRPRPRTRK